MSSTANGAFDASKVPYPTRNEITKPYGGMHYFALSYQLKIQKLDEYEEATRIVDGLRESEYQQRVEAARQEYERSKRVS